MAKTDSPKMEEIAGNVAIGATGVAIAAGVVALISAMMTDQKTRDKLAQNTQTMVSNLRNAIKTISIEGEQTYKVIKEITE